MRRLPPRLLPSRFLLLCCLPWGLAATVHADEADVFNFRVATTALRDDNLFRVPHSGGLKPQAETLATTLFGIDFNKRLSLQQFVAQVNWVDTRYQHNDYLNAGALRYDGKWLWAVGTHLKGELAADRSAAQNSFADFSHLRQRNLRTTENQRFGLDYALHPSWHVLGGVSHQTVANDQLLPQESDFEASGAQLGLRYTPASGNWMSFQTRQLDGRYTKRPFDAFSQFDNRFTQTGQELAASWQLSGHSAFNGRLEYIQRQHPHFPARDFAGWTGQLDYQYRYSARTTLTATYLRAINAFQDVGSSYYVADDWSLGSRWAATGKLAVSTRLGYSHRQYRGEVTAPAGPRREDHVGRAGVDVSYAPARWLEVKAGLAAERRNSSFNAQDYTDRQFLVSATARF